VAWLFPAEVVYLQAYDAWLQGWRPLRDPAAVSAFVASEARLASTQGFDVLVAQIEGECPPGYGRAVVAPGRVFAYTSIDFLCPRADDPEGEGAATLSARDPHPNEQGVRRMARRVASDVLELYRERSRWVAHGGPYAVALRFEQRCAAVAQGR
jgi:hypothetical protein